MEEARAHNPPTSVVPRFHAIVARHASAHSFAVLPDRPPAEVGPPRGTHRLDFPHELRARGAELRGAIIDHLAAPLGGDVLAAEYVLASLLSRVHTRTDSLALGKLSVALLGRAVSRSCSCSCSTRLDTSTPLRTRVRGSNASTPF